MKKAVKKCLNNHQWIGKKYNLNKKQFIKEVTRNI